MNQIDSELIAIFHEVTEHQYPDVQMETVFMEYGVSSITYIKLIVAIETHYEFEFDDEVLILGQMATLEAMKSHMKVEDVKVNDE